LGFAVSSSENADAASSPKMSHSENMIRYLAEEEYNFFSYLRDDYFALVYCVIGFMIFLFLATFLLREVCYRRFGIEACPGARWSLSSSHLRQQVRQQVLSDERMAMQMHVTDEREQRTAAMMQKRKERRAKYEVFLKSYKMVISNDDFYIPKVGNEMACASEPDPAMEEIDIETGSLSSDAERGSEASPGEGWLEKDSVFSPGAVVQESHSFCFESDHHVLVMLPEKTKDGTPRLVDAHCSICLTNYEEGDTIIWAARKACPHAFHDDCILTWLSKGKKRCPCCRYFFVPGTSVDDKDEIAQDSLVDQEETVESGEVSDVAVIEELRASRSPASVSSPVTLEQQDPPLADPDIEFAVTTKPEVN
jgi:hypothetical protein